MELTLDQALQKGIEAHKAGKAQEADQLYTAILKANPKHPDANHNMGVLAVGVGKVEQALPFFKTALEVNPSIAQYWLSYIDALIKLERIADAKAVFDQAKSKGAKGDGFDQIERRLGTSTAADIFKNSSIHEPTEEKLDCLIKLYNEGQFEKVYQDTKKIAEQHSANVIIWNLMGMAAAQLRKLDESLDAFKKALLLNPDVPVAHYNMGNVLQDQGKLEEAIKAHEKAILLKPDYFEAHNNLGTALLEKGYFEKAINALNKAISLKPDYVEAYNNLGIALQDQGSLEEAIQNYKTAISIEPDNIHAYNSLGIVLKALGKLEEAIGAFNNALSIEPNYFEAVENLFTLQNQLLGTRLEKLIIHDFFKSSSTKAEVRPKLYILKAIRGFLDIDQNLTSTNLKAFSNSNPKLIAKLKPKDKLFCSAYFEYLGKLVEKPFSRLPPFDIDNLIFHLGESHCLSFAHHCINLKRINYTVTPRITFGAKAFHFSKKTENQYKAITKANFHSLPDGSKVFLSFGEIDCRPNEGFVSAASKLNRPIENIISDTVEGYVSWFAKQNESKNHSLFFLNVPAAIYDGRNSPEVNQKVINTIKLFNNILNKTVLDHNLNIIDVYKFTVGHDEFSNGSFHIDQRHLSSAAIPEIEQQLET